jgi:DNA-binding PucR family transcriptional regulator
MESVHPNPTAGGLDRDAIRAEASRRSGVPPGCLGGLLDLLGEAARSGRRPDAAALDGLRAQGRAAAEHNVDRRGLVRLYLGAVELTWAGLPGIADAPTASQVRASGAAVAAALDQAVAALLDGYEGAEDQALALEEDARRGFLDDLLYGRGDDGDLAARAERFGLRMVGDHLVTLARAQQPFADDNPLLRRVEHALTERFGVRNVLVSLREGLLICVTPASLGSASGEFTHHVRQALGTQTRWRVGIGRAHPGPTGVARSFEEARDAIEFAERLDLPAQVLNAAELLVFPVLLRDRTAITDLVTTVLGPLREARGGAEPLLETLQAFFACHGNNAAVARSLHLSVRTVTYRLERVRRLTGYTPTDATQRFTLETAVVGARLLGWPHEESPQDQDR